MPKGKPSPMGGPFTRRKQLITAVALAALLFGLVLLLTVGRPREHVIDVVSLRHDVSAGVILTEEDLTLVRLPSRLARTGYLASTLQAVGQSTIHHLRAGQLLERDWLRDRPAGVAYPDAAPAARLYTLRLQPEQANGFWMAAGNLVDVHLVARSESARKDPMLPEMLPAIPIVALIGGSGASALPLQPISRQASDTPLVCLSVTAAEARILALAEVVCSIKLVPLNEPQAPKAAGSTVQLD